VNNTRNLTGIIMRYVRISALLSAGVANALVLASVLTVNAQGESLHARSISVTGIGEVATQPDLAKIRFSVVTRNIDPETARALNADASQEALDAIRSLEVSDDQIKLDHLSLSPVREWDPEQRKQIDIGFEVNRGVTVTLHDLDLVPTVVAEIVQSGANRIGGVQYEISNDQEARSEALSKAVMNARDKATVMVSTLDARLGKALEIREQSGNSPMPMTRSYAVSALEKASDSTPEAYSPGLIEIRAEVVVTFEIQ
jgi:uncharacterized protein YggE